jgi:hypothetical protein
LRCGPLRLGFESETGALRAIALGKHEVLQTITVAVRDINWGTVAPTISNLIIQAGDDAFHLTFDAACQADDLAFHWSAEISGDADGTLRYAMQGTAQTAFRANRIGFCVLHPLENCAGCPCVVEHADGTIEQTAFPTTISAYQPFLQIRALTHRIRPGIHATVRFEGDTFEMEDHRNWTDASFKTYCPPLSLPFPSDFDKGRQIRQSVTLSLAMAPRARRRFSLATSASNADNDKSDPIRFRIAGESHARNLPRIGLAAASHGKPLTDLEGSRLRALNLSHLRVDIRLFGENGGESPLLQSLHAAIAEAARICPTLQLECALFLPADADSRTLTTQLRTLLDRDKWGWDKQNQNKNRLQKQLVRLLVFHEAEKVTSRETLEQVRAALSHAGGLAFPIVGGTNAYFAELNRGRLPLDLLSGVCYSLNPQVHAFDNVSLMENLAAQAETVRSAKAIAGGKRISVSPVTLRPRFNPNATGPEPTQLPGELPPQVDARQMSLFAATWTLGSLKYLSESGAFSITYYETTGWRGVMETEAGSPLPERFPSLPGAVFPLYHVLADLGEFRSGKIWPVASSLPLQAVGMFVRKADHAAFLCANLTALPQRVTLPFLPPPLRMSAKNQELPEGRACRIRLLDAANAEFAMREPERYRAEAWQAATMPINGLDWTLPPYAIMRLDFEEVQDA